MLLEPKSVTESLHWLINTVVVGDFESKGSILTWLLTAVMLLSMRDSKASRCSGCDR